MSEKKKTVLQEFEERAEKLLEPPGKQQQTASHAGAAAPPRGQTAAKIPAPAPAERTYEVPTHREKVFGPNEVWDVAPHDWRDGDLVLVLDGAQVYPVDANHAAVEPDWAQGWTIRWGDRDFQEGVDQDGKPLRLYFRGTNRPPDIIADAYLQGRILYGVIVARDRQRHN